MGEENEDVFDKLAEDELVLLLGTLKEPACLPGETFLPGDLAFPFKDVVLFLWMEWAMTPDPLPVYSLSPIDMVITIWGTKMPPPPINVHKRLAHKSLGVARGTASNKSSMYPKRHQLNAPDIVIRNSNRFKLEQI